jgi:DNA-directed RNA polymerase subunit M/transcription elongation factor TFIIS
MLADYSTNDIIQAYSNTIDYMQTASIDDYDKNKLYIPSSDFFTENSRDIPFRLIRYTNLHINRSNYLINLTSLLNDILLAYSIEASIYEFSLIYAHINNIDEHLIFGIYNDKYLDIYMNIDSKSRINNTTLLKYIKSGVINPKIIAFLSPNQLHPENWASILNKIKFNETTENNMCTTDIYTCSKCGERKSKITEQQLRGADEPSTKFITCMVCYNTFLL